MINAVDMYLEDNVTLRHCEKIQNEEYKLRCLLWIQESRYRDKNQRDRHISIRTDRKKISKIENRRT